VKASRFHIHRARRCGVDAPASGPSRKTPPFGFTGVNLPAWLSGPSWEWVVFTPGSSAKMVLLASQGLPNDRVAANLCLPRQIVSKWRKRFFEERFAGLAVVRSASSGGLILKLARFEEHLPSLVARAKNNLVVGDDKHHLNVCVGWR
jgi:hypothetical protein